MGKFFDSLLNAVVAVAIDVFDNATYELKRNSGKTYFVFDNAKYKIHKELLMGDSSNFDIGRFSYTRNGSLLEEILCLETKLGEKYEAVFKEDAVSKKLDFKKINYSGILGKFTYSR